MNLIETLQLAVVSLFTSIGRGILRFLLPSGGTVFAAGPGGDPNVLGTFLFMVPMDACFETTPTQVEVPILACPDDLGVQLALEYVGFRANTLPIDSAGTGTILGDLEHIDDSDSDAVSNLVADYNFEGGTALVNNTVFVGWKVLDPGDAVNFEIKSDGTNNTASEGAGCVVMGKILAKSS